MVGIISTIVLHSLYYQPKLNKDYWKIENIGKVNITIKYLPPESISERVNYEDSKIKVYLQCENNLSKNIIKEVGIRFKF